MDEGNERARVGEALALARVRRVVVEPAAEIRGRVAGGRYEQHGCGCRERDELLHAAPSPGCESAAILSPVADSLQIAQGRDRVARRRTRTGLEADMQSLTPRLALAGAIGSASLLVPATAGATSVPGPNGTVAFTSGRAPQNNDAEARIWITAPPFGSATQVTTSPPSGQHRQPNWSPDHTKLVYSISPPGELRAKDFVTGTDSQFVAGVAGQDRPSWSPDGTRIAYGNGSDIYVKGVAPGSLPQQITNNANVEERPVWSPDGNTIFYDRTVAANDD